MIQSERFRWQRLAALAALSAVLHLAVLWAIGWRAHFPERRAAPSNAPIQVRMAPAPLQAAPAPPPPPPLAAQARPQPARAPASVPVAPVDPSPAPAAAVAALADPEAGLAAPPRYTMRMPPPVVLSYDVSEGPDMAARATPSRLVWQASSQRYSLRFENVPDAQGGAARTYTSEGGVNDGGIAPDSALEEQEGSAATRTSFEREANRIAYPSGAETELNHSTQDTVSILMQIAGMGLARPEQMQDTLAFEVATAAGPVVMRFDVSGPEQLATPLGTLEVWKLTQQARPGQVWLELWLAPAMSWYPVQLRTSGPAGVISLQRLRSASGAAP